MPNWCENDLMIFGDKYALDLLEDSGFIFDKILPMPKIFSDDAKTDNIGGQISRRSFEKLYTRQPLTEDDYDFKQVHERMAKGEISVAKVDEFKKAIRQHGCAGWYDWSIVNWGTKWDSSEVEIKRVSETELHAYFCTAWGPPMELLKYITKAYDVKIYGRADIEGNESVVYTLIGGEETSYHIDENAHNTTMFIGGPPHKGWRDE